MSEAGQPGPLGASCESAAEVVLSARKAAGLTQKQLAERLGTTASVISHYENRRTDPTVDTLARVVGACGLELRLSADRPRPAHAPANRPPSADPDLARRQARVKEIMALRAKAHAEAEAMWGKPKVMPGFQEEALRLLKDAVRRRASRV